MSRHQALHQHHVSQFVRGVLPSLALMAALSFAGESHVVLAAGSSGSEPGRTAAEHENAPLSLPASPAAILELAETSWSKGLFRLASRQSAVLLLDDSRLSQQELSRLYLLKARLELTFEQVENARYWLGKMERVNPGAVLDPVKDPPELHALWQEAQAAGQRVAPRSSPALLGDTLPRPVALAVLPLGVGHFDAGRPKDGFLFLSTSLLMITGAMPIAESGGGASSKDVEDRSRDRARDRAHLFSGLTLTGVYGYELLSMMPDLYARNRVVADRVYRGLSVAPFGAAQFKNGDTLTGLTVAATQAVLLTGATVSTDARQRRTMLGLFAFSWLYSAVDGVAGHKAWAAPTMTSNAIRLYPDLVRTEDGAVMPALNLRLSI